ncbi:tautomerase family protein [Alcaligenaceae bacterium]|nr:tautomerase family protein [Alcaligenaceae bacterium]
MPIFTVHLSAGHTPAQKTALLQQSSQAVTQALNAPLASVRMALHELAPDSNIVAGEMGAAQLLYIAYLIEGRGPELKAALIAALSAAASASIGISQQDVRVIIQDVPKTDIGVAGGITALAAGR